MKNILIKSLALTFLLFTQILPAEEKPWSHSLSLGINITKGNSDTEQINADYKGSRAWGEISKLDLEFSANFGSEDDVETNENYKAEAQFNRYISTRWYWLIKTSYEIDKIAFLDRRLLFGPGLGYSMLNSEKNKLDFEFGLGYLSTKFKNTSDESDLSFRLAENYERHFSKKSKLWQGIEYLGKSDDGGDYVLNTELGVQTNIAGAFSVKSFISNTYTSEPATNKKKSDTAFTTMLVYSF